MWNFEAVKPVPFMSTGIPFGGGKQKTDTATLLFMYNFYKLFHSTITFLEKTPNKTLNSRGKDI